MRKLTVVLFIAIFLVPAFHGMSYAFSPVDQDCSKCHTPSKEQAIKTLSEMIPDIKVMNVRPSEIKGLWEISMESGGRKGIIYLDYSGKHLMAGNLFLLATKTNLTQEKMQELTKIDVSKIPLEDALVMGDKNAKFKVIVFDDPD